MDQPVIHAKCPFCLEPDGHVRGMRITSGDQRTLTYTCGTCRRSWQSESYRVDGPDEELRAIRQRESDDVDEAEPATGLRRPLMRATLPTTRETTVLRLLVWGYTNKQISERLNRSVKTVESHKYNAMRKLKLRNLADVVSYGAVQGWLQPDSDPVRNPQLIEQWRFESSSEPADP